MCLVFSMRIARGLSLGLNWVLLLTSLEKNRLQNKGVFTLFFFKTGKNTKTGRGHGKKREPGTRTGVWGWARDNGVNWVGTRRRA